jgi:hypothetical protein
MSFTLTFGQEGNCATAQVVWSVDGKTYDFRSDNNFVAWISTIFTVADVVAGGGGSELVTSNQLPPVQGGVGNLWAEYGTAGSVVGNARGVGAVDWQQNRNLATEVASGLQSTVGGGGANTASGDGSTVGGGGLNNALDLGSTVAGGGLNTASGQYATVGGGQSNTASGQYATASGGRTNTASGSYATIGGGKLNTASFYASTIGGGYNNDATGNYTTVGGGYQNTVSATYATVGGGNDNSASSVASTVSGGYNNIASGNNSFVGGGYNNTASGYCSKVGGGKTNTASSTYATVGGGESNTASGNNATVGGGNSNTASGSNATVGGGYQNTASAGYATVMGGYQNTASAGYATVMGGYQGLADRWGMVAHASGQFSSKGDAQAVEFVARNETDDTNTSVLFLNGSSTSFAVTNNSVLSGICTISGFSTSGTKVGIYQRSISIKNVGGTTTLVHSSTISTDHEDDPTWAVSITANNTTDSLQIACTGSTGDTVRWVAVFRGLQILMP